MATDLGYVLIIGFASMKATEFYKEITRRIGLHQVGWWKSLVCLVSCGLLVFLVARPAGIRVLIALAAAGLAALLHATDTVLRSHRDTQVAQIMSRNQRRR
jgi:Na+/melibiose symporter-like transporter